MDSQATKHLCDFMCLPAENLHGYVQEISLDPFGLYLVSELQVNLIFYLILNFIK